MITKKHLIVSAYKAESKIEKHRFAAFGTNKDGAIQASVNNKPCLGVSAELDADAGDHADIVIAGITPIEYGGTVEAGQALTADAQGKAVSTTATTGAIAFGKAMVGGAAGDIGAINIAQLSF